MNDSVTVRDPPVARETLRYVVVPSQSLRLALPGYGRVRIGRDEACDVILRAVGVEDAHAFLHVDDYGIQVEAIADRVTIVGPDGSDRPLPAGDTFDLREDDRVKIGAAELQFRTSTPIDDRTRVWSVEALTADLDEFEVGHQTKRTALLCLASQQADELEGALVEMLDIGPSMYRLDAERFVVLWRGVVSADAQHLSSRIGSELETRGLRVASGLAHSSETPLDALLSTAKQRAQAAPTPGAETLFIGEGLAEVVTLADRIASTMSPVLILGETGTGKNLVARLIHDRSTRRSGPFVTINSSDLDPTTDEHGGLAAVLPRATGGTLVLDEVSALPPRAQLGLGRFLEQLEAGPSALDVRILATSNRNLDVDEETHSFRLDLLFRLNRVSVRLPPLRDRSADLLPLAEWLLARAARVRGGTPPRLADRTKQALERYRWPGNVRQMENALERALLICDGDLLEPQHLPAEVRHGKTRAASRPSMTLKEEVAELEKRRIIEALDEHPSQAAAARSLGIPLRTFVTRMDAFDIPRARSGPKEED